MQLPRVGELQDLAERAGEEAEVVRLEGGETGVGSSKLKLARSADRGSGRSTSCSWYSGDVSAGAGASADDQNAKASET